MYDFSDVSVYFLEIANLLTQILQNTCSLCIFCHLRRKMLAGSDVCLRVRSHLFSMGECVVKRKRICDNMIWELGWVGF